MTILAVKEDEGTTVSPSAVWNDIVKMIETLGITEETCLCSLRLIRNYGNRRAYEASENSAQTALTLALDDCRVTLEGLLERLNRTSGRINRGLEG